MDVATSSACGDDDKELEGILLIVAIVAFIIGGFVGFHAGYVSVYNELEVKNER